MNKTGESYWNRLWERVPLPQSIEPRDAGIRNYPIRKFHDLFCRSFSGMTTDGRRLLEVGCAQSAWLPYFKKHFGFYIEGIDYSEIGCEQAKQLLAREGVKGEIVCGDFFVPPDFMIESFDVVISFGVVEHFPETALCIKALSRFLKSGGLLITTIPNMLGLNGFLQKILNRPVFDIHVPLSSNGLAHAHHMAGLSLKSCGYFLFAHFGVLNIDNLKNYLLYPMLPRFRTLLNVTLWSFERAVPVLKPNGWSSPYITCLAVKT
jgi:SAM-dependent methyltransferase